MEEVGSTPLGLNAATARLGAWSWLGAVARRDVELGTVTAIEAEHGAPLRILPARLSRKIPHRRRRGWTSLTPMKAGQGRRGLLTSAVGRLEAEPRLKLLSAPLYTSVLLGRKFV